jgi:hypothetical protein
MPQMTGMEVTANTMARKKSGSKYWRRRFASGRAARAQETANDPPESTGVGSDGIGIGGAMNREANCLRGGAWSDACLISRSMSAACWDSVGKDLSFSASESNMSRARIGVSGTGESGEGGTSVWALVRDDEVRRADKESGGTAEEDDPALALPHNRRGERALIRWEPVLAMLPIRFYQLQSCARAVVSRE